MSREQLTEEELRALQAEMERITVDDVLLQTVVSLINLGARKGGLGAPPGEPVERDLEQLRLAIEGARALLPVLEPRHGENLGPVRDTLAQLQMAYAQLSGTGAQPAQPGAGAGGSAPGGAAPGGAAPGGGAPGAGGPGSQPGQPGEAVRSGRLWVPGQ
jgi:hypothetical protein